MADKFAILFEDEENDDKLTINKKFAAKYKKFKECQELDKLKEKYGDKLVEESIENESSSESEDEDAEALTPQIEQDFLKTLSMIKTKDPQIYNKKTVFFNQESGITHSGNQSFEKKEKPLFLKDYERERLLTKGSKAYLSDSESDTEDVSHFKKNKNSDELTYNEEQKQLKESFKDIVNNDSSDDSAEELLTIRQKTSDELRQEERDYKQWLKKEESQNGALSRYWTNKDLDEGESFLRDYILKKQYMDTETSRIPTYNEIVGDKDEDEEELEREEEFEKKYNFRFEEPDQEFIKRYPRTVAESVRRKDERRTEQRKERKERKEKEKSQKKEELKRLKKLKRKEVLEKIEKLKEITGNNKVGFLEDDIGDDFDPSKYDQLMSEVFDDDYYKEDEDQKPIFSDGEENDFYEENWDDWTGQNGTNQNEDEYEPYCEDPDFNMDADFVPNQANKIVKTENRKNKKGKYSSKFAEVLRKNKPVFNPDEKSFQEYFDEYYQLDYEDLIGDMPVRFKYRNVLSNDFGLSTEEILNADEKELNEWCSLKKTIRYYTDEEERKERQKFKKKCRNKQKKKQVFRSLAAESEDDEKKESVNVTEIEKPRNIRKMQKKKEKLREVNVASKPTFKRKMMTSKFSRTKSKLSAGKPVDNRFKKLEKQFKGSNPNQLKKLSLERLAAYGLDKRKKKKKM